MGFVNVWHFSGKMFANESFSWPCAPGPLLGNIDGIRILFKATIMSVNLYPALRKESVTLLAHYM
jgi:hypothetical protein